MILWSADPTTWISRLDALGYQQPPWSTFAIDTTTAPCAPVKNTVRDNRWCMVKAPPPAPPTGGCVDCPAGRFGYGDPVSGHWCCSVPVPATGGCPSANICCLEPGSKKVSIYGKHGCEGIQRCGTNPCASHHLPLNVSFL